MSIRSQANNLFGCLKDLVGCLVILVFVFIVLLGVAIGSRTVKDAVNKGESCAKCERDADCDEGLSCMSFTSSRGVTHNRCASSTTGRCSL